MKHQGRFILGQPEIVCLIRADLMHGKWCQLYVADPSGQGFGGLAKKIP
jgi:hypothetical protein